MTSTIPMIFIAESKHGQIWPYDLSDFGDLSGFSGLYESEAVA